MTEESSRTLVCAVMFLDIVGYSKKGVGEQLQLKQRFNSILTTTLEQVSAQDRVVVDTGDGAAITFLSDPEKALFVALGFLDEIGELPVRMGMNLGPVVLVRDINDQMNVLGDGINTAERVMSFAKAGQLLISRPFYDTLSLLSDDYATLFQSQGTRADKHDRSHEVFAVAEGVRVARRVAGTQSRLKSQRRAVAQPAPRTSVEQERPAQVFDAGTHLIVSGPSRASVQTALDQLAAEGGKLISPITQLGNKWMASCAHPRMQECKVEEFGYTRYITGPTREAVAEKVEELVRFGAVLNGEIAYNDGQWSAVCDTTGSRR